MNNVVLLLSGPNLDRLGTRQPEIYGHAGLVDHEALARVAANAHGFELRHVQSASEAELICAIHRATDDRAAAIVINPGAFTHYAWGLHDALAAFPGPVVELHLSNPNRREEWRHTSVVAPVATATIAGCGALGYRLAVDAAVDAIRP